MKTKYVNANIKSKEELAQRLMDGEVFYCGGFKIYYDKDVAGSPFRFDDAFLKDGWDDYKALLTKQEIPWYEDPDSFPCLCWVDHFDKNPRGDKHEADIIIWYEDGCYVPQRDGTPWKHATPVTDEELKEFGLQKIDKNQ